MAFGENVLIQEKSVPSEPERRSFLKKAGVLLMGGVCGLLPAGAALPVFLDPFRRKVERGGPVQVTTLEALPADGIPRRFPVLASRSDVWNKYPRVPVGAVYLRRTADGTVEALNVVCPHAGCFIDFIPQRGGFLCPCHNSRFQISGEKADAKSPSPRGLDRLAVEIRNENEVWVKFEQFQPGRSEKIPLT